MSALMSIYRSGVSSNGKDSPRMSSGGTQRSVISASKVEPWTGTDNESLELIYNPGSAKGSQRFTPTPPLEKEVKAFKPAEDGLLYFGNKGFSGMENMNAVDSEGLSALHRAVRVDDITTVVSLLDNGADINLKSKSGFTPLHTAARFDRAEIAKILLQRGADPLITNDNQLTPLHSAARRGYVELCSLLLKDPGVQASFLNHGNLPPFHLACLSGSREVCELFLKSGVDLTLKHTGGSTALTALHIAAWKGHEDICEFLIETASKRLSSVSDFVNQKDGDGSTALQRTCFGGYEGIADLLLRHGADVEAIDTATCTTALHLAAKHGHLTLVELFILYGVIIDGRDGSLRTPLHSAAAFNHGRIVELLLENGADPEAKDMLSMTPFLFAVTFGASESVKVLLDNGADITATDSSLNSCLHLAVDYRKEEMVKMLLERDKDKVLPLKDNHLRTVVHLAAGLEDSKILEILLQHKCQLKERDVNENTVVHVAAKSGSLHCLEALSTCPGFSSLLEEREETGMTPLHLAAGNKQTETCQFLISKGANVKSSDGNSRTALHWAVKAGSFKTVKVLLGCLLPSTLEQKDSDNNTPLHVACMHNHREILKFLLDKGADVTARNDRNMTCLDVAIEWEAGEVAKTLIRHERWQEVLSSQLSDGSCPMQKLIEKLPDVAEIVLDRCITYSPLPPSHEDFSVTFNLFPLDPDVNAEYEKAVFFAPAVMATYRRERLLNHTVTQALLRWKWMILGKFITLFNTASFAVFVILYTCLVVIERQEMNASFLSSEVATNTKVKRESGFAKAASYVLLIFLIMHLIKEISQVAWLRLSYLKDLTNLLDMLMFGMVWIFIFPFLTGKDFYSMKTQWTAGIVGLLLCYFNLTLSLRRFGGLGLYVTMYVEVLFTFIKVISTFLIALTGYSLAFYILLKEQGNFSEFWFALAKIQVMMIGELDYTDMLAENIVNNSTVPGTNVPFVPLPTLTILLFLLFVFMVSVVLVNLLVGLAVGDIDTIQKTASLRALIDQVLLVDHMMKSYPRFILRRIHKSSLEIKPNQNSFVKRVALAGTDLTDRDFLDVLLSHKSSGPSTSEEWFQYEQMKEEKQEENIRKLQATVEAQGKLLKAMADRLNITE